MCSVCIAGKTTALLRGDASQVHNITECMESRHLCLPVEQPGIPNSYMVRGNGYQDIKAEAVSPIN